MKHQIFAVFFLVLASCSATTEKYFAAESIPSSLIEPPYAINSKEWQDDIQQILKLQKNFNLNELELASREKYLRPEIFILYADRSLTREAYPKLYLLFDRISITSKEVNDIAKYGSNVTRPYLADKRINMLITPSPGPSYPSGHATISFVNAQILGLLIPQKNQDLLKLAKRICGRRILVGMHYPHDIATGEQMSRLIVGSLLQNENFQEDFNNALIELEKNPPKNLSSANSQAATTTKKDSSVTADNKTLPTQ
jgi:acid phosphatase (class A)